MTPSTQLQLRTAAWYGDSVIELPIPAEWDVTTFRPPSNPTLSDEQILDCLKHPVGQPPITELCKGKKRPLIMVDDLNRPTPTARIMPLLLTQFQQAGIAPGSVTILMGGGSHGASTREASIHKVGAEVAASCRFLVHQPSKNTVRVGKTSFGTPVHVNREVMAADFVMGIGGVYPNNTGGFGGGSKIVMGVLDLRVISQLHRQHKGAGWAGDGFESAFRKDLNEIADMIGLRSLISLHIGGDRELVRMVCGDYRQYYPQEVTYAKEFFSARKPDNADVVISNAFPNDLSLTFVHMKGVYPLRQAASSASRIVVAACSEGEGFHGVYPIVRMPKFHEQRDRVRRITLMAPAEIVGKIAGKIAGKLGSASAKRSPAGLAHASVQSPTPAKPKNPIWLYLTRKPVRKMPSPVRGIRVMESWSEIVGQIQKEQGGRSPLRVFVYPCAPLQILN